MEPLQSPGASPITRWPRGLTMRSPPRHGSNAHGDVLPTFRNDVTARRRKTPVSDRGTTDRRSTPESAVQIKSQNGPTGSTGEGALPALFEAFTPALAVQAGARPCGPCLQARFARPGLRRDRREHPEAQATPPASLRETRHGQHDWTAASAHG